MSKPRVGGFMWALDNPLKSAIFNINYSAQGVSIELTLNPWVAVTPTKVARFGSYEDARRHMVEEGWRKL